MTVRVRRATAVRLGAAVLLAVSLLSACGGDDKPEGAGKTSSPSVSATPSPSVSVPPGVDLTEPGTELAYGDTATVAYAPSQDLASVVSLTVRSAEPAKIKDLEHGFALDTPYKKNADYYYVRVHVENLGSADLGRRDVPVWGVNADDHLLPAVVFDSAFPKCPSKRLPKSFTQGDTFSTCLVFASPDHGELSAVRFQPNESYTPIDWR
ncbi:MAG: hypothetical protein QM655_03600 [Nocardioidaceae bacterium]